MRDQAISNRRKPRRRSVRSGSSLGLRRRRGFSFGWVPRVLPTLVYLSVLILAAWLLYYSIASPYFAVREISVSGNKLLDADRARDAAGSLGQNVLRLRGEEIEQAVARISVVKSARAVLALPGRLDIDVTERTPLVQWQAREGSFLVDREGVVFSRQAPPGPVAVVKEWDGPAMDVGSRIDPHVLAAVETLELTLPEQAGIQPSWFDYSRSSGIAVPAQGGPRIILGDADDLEAKVAALVAIRTHLATSKARAEIIDLRFNGRPVYVLASTTPAKSGQAR
ncbi:MAG: FtsQ-type POTRA domain-containing protein [Chloroflexi bacterium]|nr:FtsQ-type POTRA domain-containing protein [Chloroflexota bacterium]